MLSPEAETFSPDNGSSSRDSRPILYEDMDYRYDNEPNYDDENEIEGESLGGLSENLSGNENIESIEDDESSEYEANDDLSDDEYYNSEEEHNEEEHNEEEHSEEEHSEEEYNEEEYNEEEDHGHIIDEALNRNKMPTHDNNSEFTPYFENFTTAALFCWLQKHNISTSAYEDLAEIIHNPQFVTTHIVKNVHRFRTWRNHLSFLSISERSISISLKKTPSTSKDSKMSYQLLINDIIWHVLNNPSLMKHMYFGPGIDSELKSEHWHGTLWAESPFFGQEQLMILEGNGFIWYFI